MGKKNIVFLLFICFMVFLLNPGSILANDNETPPTPENLNLSPIASGFLVTWSPDSGDSVMYKIYWGTDDSVSETNYSGVITTSNASYEHTGLVPGWIYYYRIMACGCECSQLSSLVSAPYQHTHGGVYTLSGTVTVDGVPVRPGMMDQMVTATVRATEVTGANQGNSAGVNPDGTYEMVLFSGTYNISVDYGFGESWHGTGISFGSWGYPGPENLPIGEDTPQDIDLPLHTLTGKVTDTGGNPLPNVQLSYFGPCNNGSTTNGSTKTSAEAGFEGTYKLYFLPGTYSLEVKPPAGTRFGPVTMEVNVPGTAPSIELQEQSLFSLSGTITINGVPIQPTTMDPVVTATVRATEVTGANQGGSAGVNPDGTYQMALLPGTYDISVDYWSGESWQGTWIDSGSWGYPGPQNLLVGADSTQDIDMPLYPLIGKVTDTSGNPLPGVQLSYFGSSSNGSTANGSATTSAEAGFEGTYKLYFPPGTYSLEVKPAAGTRFVPVTVEVSIPGTVPPVELREQPLLSGTVTINGVPIQPGMTDPVVTATVRATEVTGANQGGSAGVNPDGTYQMALLPGTYNISVDYWSRESWHGTGISLASWGYPGPENVSIGEDTTQDIDIPLHTLTGKVTDTSGNPVPAVQLSYFGSHSNGSITTSAETGFEGTYKLYFLQETNHLQVTSPPAIFPPFQVKKIHIFGDATRNIFLSYDCEVLDRAMAMIPPHLELHLDRCDVIIDGETNAYDFVVSAPRDLVKLIINWPEGGMQGNVRRPDGTLYGRYQPDTPPIIVDIANPEVGTWTCEVIADDIPYDNYQVAVVAGFTPNQPPVADAGGSYSGKVGTSVILDAGNSHDPGGNIVLYEWDWENDGIFDESTTQPTNTHTWDQSYDGNVRLRVTDEEGFIEIDCAPVKVAGSDPSAPDITLSARPNTLWPPNHKMAPVSVHVHFSEPHNPEPACHITSVTSSEPEDGSGDGHTAPDWKITGDLTVNLRAERSGGGDGRIYTIKVECTDASGNTAAGTTEVTVPHDQGKHQCCVEKNACNVSEKECDVWKNRCHVGTKIGEVAVSYFKDASKEDHRCEPNERIIEPGGAEKSKRIPGDCDGDKDTDLADAHLAFKRAVFTEEFSDGLREADVDGDNTVGIAEVVYILQKVSGLR